MKYIKESRGIIVLGGHVQALGIIRILGRNGIPSVILDNTHKNLARHSKYCTESFVVDDNNILDYLTKMGDKIKSINQSPNHTNTHHAITS